MSSRLPSQKKNKSMCVSEMSVYGGVQYIVLETSPGNPYFLLTHPPNCHLYYHLLTPRGGPSQYLNRGPARTWSVVWLGLRIMGRQAWRISFTCFRKLHSYNGFCRMWTRVPVSQLQVAATSHKVMLLLCWFYLNKWNHHPQRTC